MHLVTHHGLGRLSSLIFRMRLCGMVFANPNVAIESKNQVDATRQRVEMRLAAFDTIRRHGNKSAM